MTRVIGCAILLCGILMFAGVQAIGDVILDVPFDQQIGTNGIYVPSGLNGALSFKPAAPPDEPEGFCRNNFNSGWYYGPYIDVDNAGLPHFSIAEPNKLYTMQVDCRYFQHENIANRYGDAPIFLRLYSYDDPGKTVGGYRDYSIFYATQSVINGTAGQVGMDPPYPTWTTEVVPLNVTAMWPYTQGGIGGGVFNPANVCRLRFYGTDWSGQGQDFIDVKNFLIQSFDVGTISGVINDTYGNLVGGATVTATPGGYSTTSAANGTYTLAYVPVGTYTLTVTSPLYSTQTRDSVSVTVGETTTENFTLVPTYGWINGTVVDGSGKGLAGAIVGFKTSAKGTADAQEYVIADNLGKFSKQVGNGTYYIGAWTYGYLASPDVVVNVSGNTSTITVPVTTKAGANIAIGATATATSSDPGDLVYTKAVDGNYGSRWATMNPLPDTEQDQTYTIDLGTVKDIAGVTIWWENAYPSDYTVDVTTGDPATGPWTNVYAVTGASGGWDTGYSQHIDPINLAAPVPARAIRFHVTKFGNYPVYSAWEFVVHGTTPDPNVYSRISEIKDLPDGTPVDIYKEVSVSGITSAGNSTIYPDYFWYEEYDRTAGIRVHAPGHAAWPGELDRTIGTMATDAATGERYIEATQDIQYLGFGGTVFAPLAITNRTAATDKKTPGLIVTTWGKVVDVDADRNWFTISDGSEVPVKVYRSATRADAGTFVTVTGVLGAEPAIYEPVTNGIVTTWLFNGSYSVADPLPSDPIGDSSDPTAKWHTWQGLNLAQDFLASVGGEANIVPKPGDTAPKGTWFVASKSDGQFDLNSLPFVSSGAGMRAEYASVWFYSPGTYKYSTDALTAWVASDDGYKLWINGVVAAENNIWRGMDAGNPDEIKAGDEWTGEDTWVFNPGWNHVLVKITDVLGGHGFFVKFTVKDSTGTVVPLSLPATVSAW